MNCYLPVKAQKICYAPANLQLADVYRWIFASASIHFNQIAATNSLPFFIEGTHRETDQETEYLEFRMDGPHSTQQNRHFYIFNTEINILWAFHQNNEDFHRPERLKGILLRAMSDICIYKYGNGPNDDDSLLETLQLKQDKKTPTRVNNFGQIRPDVRLIQGTVEGSYEMSLYC